MSTDTRKIQIIEAVLKTEDENILSEVEKIIAQPNSEKKKVLHWILLASLAKKTLN